MTQRGKRGMRESECSQPISQLLVSHVAHQPGKALNHPAGQYWPASFGAQLVGHPIGDRPAA